MAKSADAFRTISEVAEWLDIQAHVLRFWESKFTQVKPIKRAGGRRYYRPADMLLLGGIKHLLHEDGLTIKGVQKILREEGMNHVASLSAPLDELSQADLDSDALTIDMPDTLPEPAAPAAAENVVLPFTPQRDTSADAPTDQPTAEKPRDTEQPPQKPESSADLPEPVLPTSPAAPSPPAASEPDVPAPKPEPTPPVTVDQTTATPVPAPGEDAPEAPEPETPETDEADTDISERESKPATSGIATDQPLPRFLRRPHTEAMPEPPVVPEEPAPEPAPPEAPKPRIVDLPPLTAEQDIKAAPGALSAALRGLALSPETAAEIAPLLTRLAALRDSMLAAQAPAPKD